MIGKIKIGKSFRGCIAYCLQDKNLANTREVAYQNRAEVLMGNYCFGSTKELIRQFEEVRALNPRVAKPVLHLTLSLAPGEQLEKGTLREVVYDLASEMNFEQHQYLAVSHLDTAHQHVHLVVNRVGYDGKTLKDGHNYRRMAAVCRRLELKYCLRQVPSPKRFLPLEQRMLPRQDVRKEALRGHVEQALGSTKTLEDFYAQMKACGYQVLKGRGLSFLDDKGVKIKGSEVGYPLAKIEGALGQKRELRQGPGSWQERPETGYAAGARDLQQGRSQGERQHLLEKQNETAKTVEQLMKPVPMQEPVNPQLLQKKRQRNRRSQHL